MLGDLIPAVFYAAMILLLTVKLVNYELTKIFAPIKMIVELL